jgi:penicillin-binding protein 1B
MTKKVCGNVAAGAAREAGAGASRALSAGARINGRRARVKLYRGATEARRFRPLRLALRAAAALTVISVIAFTSLFAYFYWHYSQVVDARLASGYLSSRAGIYAAPRVVRAGQRLTPQLLAASLRRAGYVEAGATGRVWSGRFQVETDAVRIEPAASDRASDSPRDVLISFDRLGRVAEVRADGGAVDSYTLEPEPLSDETELRSDGRETLTFAELPPVLVAAGSMRTASVST